MKKKLLLSVLFLFFGNLMAQDATISIPDLTGISNTEILVPVNITPLNTVRRVGFRVKYNNSIMSIMKDQDNNPIIENSSLNGVVTGTRGDSIVTISWVSTNATNLDGKIVDLKFQYHGGTGNIEFEYVGISENPGMGYDIAQENGSISGNTNQAPSFGSVLQDTTIAETEALSYLYTGTDPDGDALTFSLVSGPDSSTMDATGNFSWTPTYGDAGVHNLIVSLTDNQATVYDTTKITVISTNRAPSFVNTLLDTTIAENETLTYLYTGTDPEGDVLNFSLLSNPDGSTMDATGNFSWTPTFDQAGVYEIIVSLTDGIETVFDTSNVTVIEKNGASSFTNTLPDTTIAELELLTYLYTGTDLDGDPLAFALVSGPDGSAIGSDGSFSWTPTYDQAGVYDVVASLTDGIDIVFDTTQVTVTETNRAPYFTNTLPGTTIVEMEILTYLYAGVDPDGDALTFSLESGPTGASINADGNFSWATSRGEAGVYDLVVAGLSDGQVMVYDTTSITVLAANEPPFFTKTLPDTTVTEGILLSYQYEGDDPDGDALTFAIFSGPNGATVSEDGTLNWTPATPDDIIATIIISLTDQAATVYDTAEVSALTGINDLSSTIPDEFELGQNYPNPFNPSTTISYSLPENAMVNLTVYDITGQEIATLLNTEIAAGFHRLSFDATKLAGGVYLYRIMATNSNGLNFINTKKMLLIK